MEYMEGRHIVTVPCQPTAFCQTSTPGECHIQQHPSPIPRKIKREDLSFDILTFCKKTISVRTSDNRKWMIKERVNI